MLSRFVRFYFFSILALSLATSARASSTADQGSRLAQFIDGCVVASESFTTGRAPASNDAGYRGAICAQSIEVALAIAIQAERVPLPGGLAVCVPPNATLNHVLRSIAQRARSDRQALMAFEQPREFVVGMLWDIYPCRR